VKSKALLLPVSFAVLSACQSFAQVNCTSTSSASGKLPLVCQFPVSAQTLSVKTFGSAALTPALATAVPINAAIAAQLTELPVPSATVGVVSLRRKGSEVPFPFDNLGPILTDRPDTVGRGHLFAGFGYQHFNFNALDGFNLHLLPIAYTFIDPVGTVDPKVHYGFMDNSVRFQLDQYVILATFGVTPTTDLSVTVPFNSVSVAVTSSNFRAYEYDITNNYYSNHGYTGNPVVTSNGSASGLGDITIGLKQMVLGQEHNRPAAAVGATFRFPSGDSLNYLGSGALGGSLYGLVEYRARLAPHAKLSYQWNNSSKILNLQQSAGTRLPGGIQYSIGTDFRIHRKLTLTADFLGGQIVNTPNFVQTTYAFNPAPEANSGVPAQYTLVSTPANTYTTVNFSGGVKWSPLPHFLLYGNALLQINNVGLRSDVVPLVGIAYNFKKTSAR
jgi:hypothetical protein